MNNIISSCEYVVQHSQHIKINHSKLKQFAKQFQKKYISNWHQHSPFDISSLNHKDKLHFLLILNSISFSYWGTPKWKSRHNKRTMDGAYGMINALSSAIQNKIPILNADFLQKLTSAELNKILGDSPTIPLLTERRKILNEVGSILATKYQGDFTKLVNKANKHTNKLLNLIIHNFPSFVDRTTFKKQTIYFYKRAQLLTTDIVQNTEGFTDLSPLSACADYKLPFILREHGILKYSNELASKVDAKQEILVDSTEETELRAFTIYTVELLKEYINKRLRNIESIHINDYLWLLSQTKSPNQKPYHLCRTTKY